MTPQAIRDGFEHLRSDKQMLALADAARCRSEADWLVGINGTRAMTAFNSRDGGFFLTTVGRVQTPTLSIMVEREEQIRKHVSRDYWEVRGTLRRDGRRVRGQVVRPGLEEERRRCRAARRPPVDRGRRARTSPRRCTASRPASPRRPSRASQAAPQLYDLTSLQREANWRFGFSARTTLSIAQALYEKHKVLTYPRTDSRALPEDYVAVAKQTAEMISKEALPGPLRALAVHAKTALKEGYIKPSKQDLRQRQGLRPLRHHPDAAAAEEPLGDRGQALRHGGQALPRGLLSAGRIHGHDAHLDGGRRRQGVQVPDQRQGDGQAGLAGRLRHAKRRKTTPTWWRWPRASWRAPRASTSRR